MSHLKLVSEEPTPLEELLLDAARTEEPSPEHRARLRAALGIGTPAPAALLVAENSKTAGAAWGKLAGFGGVLIGLAAVTIGGLPVLGQHRSAVPTTASQVFSARTLPTAAKVAPPPLSEPLPSIGEERTPPVGVSGSSSGALRAGRSSASAPVASDLSEQMRLIEAARSGLAARDATAALAALRDYSEKFPRGSFGQEAMVLRIRALDQAGDQTRASALARSFIVRFPGSPHVARLKPIAERSLPR